MPSIVHVAAQQLQFGLNGGGLRARIGLDGFRITKHPVTRAEYQGCVDADACSPADNELESYAKKAGMLGKPEDSPMTCLSVAQAEAFCHWVGGELPRLDQWLLAARGPAVQRFSWGDGAPNCAQHPLAEEVRASLRVGSNNNEQTPACSNVAPSEITVGSHMEGRSALGVEDILITYAELLRGRSDVLFPACGDKFSGCVVYGGVPGAIDAVAPFAEVREEPNTVSYPPRISRDAGFRCVWGE